MGEPIATVGDLAGACGHDGTDWIKLLVDATGKLQVSVDEMVAIISKAHGQYDGAWQAQPLIFGYSDVVALDELNTNADAGTNQIDLDAVPAGEVHVYYAVGGINYNSVATAILWTLVHDGDLYTFYRYLNVPANYFFVAPNPTVAGPGDNVRLYIYGCAAGDDIRATATGYKMDLDL